MAVHLPLQKVLAELEVVLVAGLGEPQLGHILNVVLDTEEDDEGGRRGGRLRRRQTTFLVRTS